MSENSLWGLFSKTNICIATKKHLRQCPFNNADLVDEIWLWWDREEGRSEGIVSRTKMSFQLIRSAERTATGTGGMKRCSQRARSRPDHKDNVLLIVGFWITGARPLAKWTNAAKNTSWPKSGNESVLKWGTGRIWDCNERNYIHILDLDNYVLPRVLRQRTYKSSGAN